MISRPIVAAPLAGLILGDPQSGMLAGALLEIFSLHQLPIGANRHWDTGPAAVAAAAAMQLSAGLIGLVIAVGVGVFVGWVGSWLVHGMRHLNARLVVGETGRRMLPYELTARHFAAMAVDFTRAALLTLTALLAVHMALGGDGSAPEVAGLIAAGAAIGLAGLALGADVRMMAGGRRVWLAFGASAVVSAVFWIWLY
jgi:mannose/fructose/N-acetylgalactosamine-specific phosphotransferase system component IIC